MSGGRRQSRRANQRRRDSGRGTQRLERLPRHANLNRRPTQRDHGPPNSRWKDRPSQCGLTPLTQRLIRLRHARGRDCRFSWEGALRDAARRRRLLRANGGGLDFTELFPVRAEEAPSSGAVSKRRPTFIDSLASGHPGEAGLPRREQWIPAFETVDKCVRFLDTAAEKTRPTRDERRKVLQGEGIPFALSSRLLPAAYRRA